ncbi:MAG: hypothetical protein B1H12_00695 [Desulfobacteraceae bacterium 4484_190.2]|nr:MAG: hypothetical protein B1H12_00695 [Desulfobacteraceae bacterium 4484_190.2]
MDVLNPPFAIPIPDITSFQYGLFWLLKHLVYLVSERKLPDFLISPPFVKGDLGGFCLMPYALYIAYISISISYIHYSFFH